MSASNKDNNNYILRNWFIS